MKIGIGLSAPDFQYDIHALVQSFFPDDELVLFGPLDTEKAAGVYDRTMYVKIPELTDRKAAKNILKKELYRELSAMTAQSLPWGVLGGIRPVRIPMQALKEGRTEEEAKQLLQNEYLVSPEKADLAVRIALKEMEVVNDILPKGPSMSLYVHIPFCPTICAYCSFSSRPMKIWNRIGEGYLNALFKDIEESAKIAEGTYEGPLTIYIGGGTPTILNASQLDRLLERIENSFDLRGLKEFTVEAGRPDTLDAEKLNVLLKHGVNRISVNPQSMNEETLKRIGRQHTAEDVRRAFFTARECGFDNINMDIILGLPGEGAEEVSRTLDEIADLSPESLTVHALAVKRASRIRSEILEDRMKDPFADRDGSFRGLRFENSAELQDMVYRRAAGAGMHPYYLYRQKNMRGNLENTGFSIDGKECIYNIIMMEELQSVISCGAGGISKRIFPDGRIERCDAVKDAELYIQNTDEMIQRKRELFSKEKD